jgi:hypothetical protein
VHSPLTVIYFVEHFENYETLNGTEELLTIFIMELLKVISEGERESKVNKYLQECSRCVLKRKFLGCQC